MEHYIQQVSNFAVDDDADLCIKCMGNFRSLGNFRFFQISREWCGHFIQSGRGIFQLDGRKYEASAGDMLFLYPGAQALYYDYPESPWRYQWFRLAGRNNEEILRRVGINRSNPKIHLKNYDVIAGKLKSMLRDLTVHANSPFAPRAAAWEIMELMRRNQREVDLPPDIPDIASRCKRIIDDEFISIPDVSELARRLRVDRTTLFRHFRERFGIAPKEYIDEVKFDRACKLLRETDLLVKEIAAVCGFSDQLYFSRKFRKRTGKSPTIYRSKITS